MSLLLVAASLSWSLALNAAPPRATVLRSFETPLDASRFDEKRLARAGSTIWAVTGKKLERWRWQEKKFTHSGVWNLPTGLDLETPILLAPVTERSVWLLTPRERLAWLLVDDAWSSPVQLSDAVGSAAALSDGLLIINTPEHSASAFAMVEPGGRVRKRFGSIRAASVTQQGAAMNTWRLAVTNDGLIAAAHAHRAALRIYSAEGVELLDRSLDSPASRPLESRRLATESRVEVSDEACCVTSTLVHLATDLLAHDTLLTIRFALADTLESFDRHGRWKQSVTVAAGDLSGRWMTAGLALIENQVVAAEAGGIVVRQIPDGASPLVWQVVSVSGEPVERATITVTTDQGVRTDTQTDAQGRAEMFGWRRDTVASVAVGADGFLRTTRRGVVSEIARGAVVLTPQPAVCVRAVDANTKAPIRLFQLSVASVEETSARVSRGAAISGRSTPEGRACVSALLSPPFVVSLSAEGYATKEVNISDLEERTVELERAVPFRIEARSAADQPVPDVRVTILPSEQEARTEVAVSSDSVRTTDALGVVEFTDRAAGSHRIVAEHPRYVRLEKVIEVTSSGEPVKVVLSPGASLTVRTVVAGSGRPLAGSRVNADPRGAPVTHAPSCETRDDGACEMSGLPVGRYTVKAEQAGYTRAHDTVVIAEGAGNQDLTITLSRSTELSGRIYGADQYPGLKLQVEAAKPGVPLTRVPVSATGEFRMSEAPSGAVSFWVTDTAGSTLVHKSVEIPASSEAYRLDIQLPPPHVVSGRILDPGGAGCGGCAATFERIAGEYASTTVRAKVFGDGRYEARFPIPGPYVVRVRDAHSGASIAELLTIEQSLTHNFELSVRSMDVQVNDVNRAPVAAALVSLSSSGVVVADARSDSYGVARFDGIGADTVLVTATSDGRTASREERLTGGRTRVTLTLSGDPSLRLKIVDAVSGVPIYRADVRVTARTGESILRTNLLPDPERLFVLPAFASGGMTVVIEASGYAVKTLSGFAASEAPTTIGLTPRPRPFTVEVDISVLSPCAIQVSDTSGRPVALSARIGTGPIPFRQQSAMFSGLELGSYAVSLETCDGKRITKPLVLREGGDHRLRFP